MATNEKPGGSYAPVGGILLLFLGVLLLLQNLGVLPWGLWYNLLWFWPVIIVLIGVNIVLHRVNPWITALILIAILGTVLGITFWQYGTQEEVRPANQIYSEPLGDIKQGQAMMRFVAGDFRVASLPSGSAGFVVATPAGDSSSAGFQATLKRNKNEALLSLEARGFSQGISRVPGVKGEIDLARDIPLMLSINGVMSNLVLNLKDLTVNRLEMDAVMGNYQVEMPSAPGTINANIKGTFSNIEIVIPPGVAASIVSNNTFGVSEVDKSRFPQKGQAYVSPDYDTASRKIDLKVDSTFGRVNIK
jgi:hypothetical protein